MLQKILLILPILYVCFTKVYCSISDPRVWPETFVDDGHPFIEFTCGAYLKSGEWLSWYKGSDKTIFTTLRQRHEGYRTIKLLWPFTSLKNYQVYCSKEYNCNSGYNYCSKNTVSKSINISFQRHIEPINTGDKSGTWVTPARFVDDGKQFTKFTCYSYLNKEETLSWYQIKGTSVSMLGMIQQEANYGYMKMVLQKTLEPSDNGSHIYCKKEGKTIKEKIMIEFERHIEASETPYVSVAPSADVALFDEGDKLEFVCGGSEAVDGRALTWYLQTPDFNQVVPPDQHFCKSKNQNSLTLSMGVFDHWKQLYCAQDFTIRSDGAVSSIRSYGELARSRTVTLLHRGQCNKKDQPRVIPETFKDDHKPFVQFTCYGFLESGQLLSWYQSKGSNKSAVLLRLVQLQDPRAKEGEWVVLTLNKTLEPEDNGSEIYCARQSVLPDSSDRPESQRVPLKFQRDILPLEPFIHVEPNTTSVYFDPNTTVRLTCSGSKPVDGRNYTWFKLDPQSGRLTLPQDQQYDTSTNMNVLTLLPNQSQITLFCAQGFVSYIRHADSLQVQMYGELVGSNITLIQRDKQGNTNLILTIAIPLSLLVLVFAAAACWLRGRRAAAPAPLAPPATPAPAPHATPAPAPHEPADRDNDDNYGNYVNVCRKMDPASPQVTYAVLDLSKNASDAARAPPAREPALYAEIAGVYNP